MFDMMIKPIGVNYSRDSQIIDTVELCDGFTIIDEDNSRHKFMIGDNFRDGQIVDCFVHPESDCVWMVACCNEYYFEIIFDNYKDYNVTWVEGY